MPGTESVPPCSSSSAGSCNSAAGLAEEGRQRRDCTCPGHRSACERSLDSSVELCGEHMLVWSTDKKSEEIVSLCSFTNAQFKPQGSCKAFTLAVVLGQDSY